MISGSCCHLCPVGQHEIQDQTAPGLPDPHLPQVSLQFLLFMPMPLVKMLNEADPKAHPQGPAATIFLQLSISLLRSAGL